MHWKEAGKTLPRRHEGQLDVVEAELTALQVELSRRAEGVSPEAHGRTGAERYLKDFCANREHLLDLGRPEYSLPTGIRSWLCKRSRPGSNAAPSWR